MAQTTRYASAYGWTLPQVLTRLARSGWAGLGERRWHGLRAALQALCDHLPHGSAQGHATVAQLADSAGYGRRWMGHCLAELERLGAVEWRRGGVVAGRVVPSWFVVRKRVLLDWAAGARVELAVIVAARREQTQRRVAGLRFALGRGKRAGRTNAQSLRTSSSGERVPGRVAAPGNDDAPDWRTLAAARGTGTGSGRREGESWQQWALRRARA